MRLLLLSGGVDSSAIAWWTRPDVCLTVDYGQAPAMGEIRAAAGICREMGLRHEVLEVGLGPLGSGLMAGRTASPVGNAAEWWPYRNQMLVTLAAMRFVGEGLQEIMIGALESDRHLDGSRAFLEAMARTMALQEGGVRVTAPAHGYTPEELLRVSGFPTGLLGATFSCHAAGMPCGACSGCEKSLDLLDRYAASATFQEGDAIHPPAAGTPHRTA